MNSLIFQRLGEFDWNKTLRGVILGSFFMGYMITQVLLSSKLIFFRCTST